MLMCTYLHYCTIGLFQIIITSVGVKIIKPCLEPGARAGAGLCMTAQAGDSRPAGAAWLSISVALGLAQSQDIRIM